MPAATQSTTTTASLFALCALSVLAGCHRAAEETTRTRGEHAGLPSHADRAPHSGVQPGREQLPSSLELERYLKMVPNEHEAGGLASGKAEWAAMVNREGVLCAVAVSMPEPGEAWPGSQAVAKAKAYTANAFSTDGVPMSTARLYTLSQPGHSLFWHRQRQSAQPRVSLNATRRAWAG